MQIYTAAIGERYSDDSGWERRVEIDSQSRTLLIEITGDKINTSSDEIDWIIDALTKVRDSVK